SPVLKLTPCTTTSEKDEQKGFQFLFAGSILAVRNPRGHEYSIHDSPDECLDHLAIASVLLRRLETAGFSLFES
ncbi:MAG: TIGR02391 family protein, partial [Rhodopirellula sp.]|nr:TIGR02391 family protein [Rhodopirellula sp.]